MKTWRERIAEARKAGAFMAQDVADAGSWCSCAVGEQHKSMPDIVLYWDYEPMGPQDNALLAYGGDYGFYRAVCLHQFDQAESYLDKIEDRVLELKRKAQ